MGFTSKIISAFLACPLHPPRTGPSPCFRAHERHRLIKSGAGALRSERILFRNVAQCQKQFCSPPILNLGISV